MYGNVYPSKDVALHNSLCNIITMSLTLVFIYTTCTTVHLQLESEIGENCVKERT